MKAWLEGRIKRSRLLVYAGAFLLILFVAATIGGMLLTLNIDDQRQLLPFMVADVESEPIRPTLSGNYLASRFAREQQQYDIASEFAKDALEYSQDDPRLQAHSLRLMVAAGKTDESQELAARMMQEDTADSLAVLVHISHQIEQENYAEAAELIKKSPSGGMYQLIKPVLSGWSQVGLMQEDAIEKTPIFKFKGVDFQGFLGPFMQYQRGLMNDVLGFEDEAHAAYTAAAENASLTPYRVVQAIANFHLRHNDLEAARAIYARYELHHPDSDLKTPDNLGESPETEYLVADPKEGLAEIYFTAASLLFSERVSQETLLYLQLALSMRSDFPPAQMMLAGIFEQQENYEAAVGVYQNIDPDSIFYREGRMRIALNFRAADRTDSAIELLKQMIEESPTNEEAVNLLGDIYRYEDQFPQSAQVFSDALKVAPKHEWSWEFYHKHAMALERSGEWDQAMQAFTKALELEPDQPDVLNYLGYSLLEKGDDLDRAASLIQKAYEQEPDAAHIIDSMGWVHFMKGEYQKAVELLEQAVDIAPQDPTINEHLGDAYWRVGRKLEAGFQWERALTFEPDEPQAIEKKIENGLPKPAKLADPAPTNEPG